MTVEEVQNSARVRERGFCYENQTQKNFGRPSAKRRGSGGYKRTYCSPHTQRSVETKGSSLVICAVLKTPIDSFVSSQKGWCRMSLPLAHLWSEEQGQDIAEYAVMLAVILVVVIGTIRLIGSNANNVFSQAASSIQ